MRSPSSPSPSPVQPFRHVRTSALSTRQPTSVNHKSFSGHSHAQPAFACHISTCVPLPSVLPSLCPTPPVCRHVDGVVVVSSSPSLPLHKPNRTPTGTTGDTYLCARAPLCRGRVPGPRWRCAIADGDLRVRASVCCGAEGACGRATYGRCPNPIIKFINSEL